LKDLQRRVREKINIKFYFLTICSLIAKWVPVLKMLKAKIFEDKIKIKIYSGIKFYSETGLK
jgi:hypothetical protein